MVGRKSGLSASSGTKQKAGSTTYCVSCSPEDVSKEGRPPWARKREHIYFLPPAKAMYIDHFGGSMLLVVDISSQGGSLFASVDHYNGLPPKAVDPPSSEERGSSPQMPKLNLPAAVKYVYINIGTSWDPWPGCGTKGTKHEITSGHNNKGGLEYNSEVFCIYVEQLMRVNAALYERGLITDSSILIHAAVSNFRGLAPFYEYAGVSGVASSLMTVNEEVVADEEKRGGQGPYTSGERGQSWTTVITLKDVLDIIPKHVRIIELKTDMQGFDVTAIKSAGEDIKRIDEIFHECYGDSEQEIYNTVPTPNMFSAAREHLVPLGFEAGTSRSHDCNWRRTGVARVPNMVYIGNFA